MSYLVTGSSGFLGRRLVNMLLSKGRSVHYLGRRRAHELDTRAAFHPWSFQEKAPLDSVPPLEAIFHLAGEPISQRWNEEVKTRIGESRIQGTRNLVSALGSIRGQKPKVLVSASAVGYYGDRGDRILTELDGSGKGFLAELCADWEREASRAVEFGVRVVCVRIGIVLGQDGGALKSMLPAFKAGVGGKFGDGRQWMPWIHVDDLIHLLAFAADNPSVTGPLNGSAPEPVRNAEFSRCLAQTLHRPAVFSVPRFALRLALGELADFLLQSQRVVPQKALAEGFRFQHPHLAPALASILSSDSQGVAYGR